MIKVEICDPQTQRPFESFTHHTTQYVSVPHAHPTLLVVSVDRPSIAVIKSEGIQVLPEVVTIEDRSPQAIALSDLTVPPAPPPRPAGRLNLARLGNLMRTNSVARYAQQRLSAEANSLRLAHRLYAFTVEICDPDRAEGEEPTPRATYEFHILCPDDWRVAQQRHLELQTRPDAIAPQTLWENTTGAGCPTCRQDIERLHQAGLWPSAPAAAETAK